MQLIIILLLVTTCWLDKVDSEALGQASLEYHETLVIFGKGRRTERDLPVCENRYEACNLAHYRLWLAPITERMCRCPRRAQCPLSFQGIHDPTSQHVSNRAQLKFCEPLDASLDACAPAEKALEVTRMTSVPDDRKQSHVDTRTKLHCKCDWPKQLIYNATTQDQSTSVFSCRQLPACATDQLCGYVRPDTYEVYYTCSCPVNHLCIFKGHQQTEPQPRLVHYHQPALPAYCIPE